MVTALKEVQDANGDGYLSAFPREHFDRLEARVQVWAPYYVVRGVRGMGEQGQGPGAWLTRTGTGRPFSRVICRGVQLAEDARQASFLPRPTQIHKIMAGLLDQHGLLADPDALGMAERMAAYFCGRWERGRGCCSAGAPVAPSPLRCELERVGMRLLHTPQRVPSPGCEWRRVESVIQNHDLAYWHAVLEVEFGGMNEVWWCWQTPRRRVGVRDGQHWQASGVVCMWCFRFFPRSA